MTYHFAFASPSTNAIAAKPQCRHEQATVVEREAMLHAIPTLRRFARSLTGDADRANDLVQEALLRGIANIHRFQPGTNIEAWLMVILRNSFLSQIRAAKHETAHKALLYGEPIAAHPNQLGAVQLRELRQALTKVPQDQREALLLVAGYGYSYDDAARMCGCPAGTIKSRVNRARFHLRKLMQTSCATEFGPDERNVAVLAATLVGTPQLQQFK